MADTMEFVRGDGCEHEFSIPTANWKAGGRLFFIAKVGFDDDDTDSSAQIEGSWNDADVFDEIIDGVQYKTYRCVFPGSATNSLKSNGAPTADYLGEFQYVPPQGDPITFPADSEDKIDVLVNFDLKRKTVV